MSGRLDIVGLGPGAPEHRTVAAVAAVASADVVIGYGPYVDQCVDLLGAGQRAVRGAMGEEHQRAREAIEQASEGRRVALVCSGDPGVYGMAARTLALAAEVPEESRPPVRVVPGVTAATAAAALLGAPLADDFAVLSLSDLHLDWEVIERRLRALAGSGLALCLYNPRSRGRTWQLERALELLQEARPGDTPAALVHDAARPEEAIERTTLASIDPEQVTMRTLVLIAGESARAADDWLVAIR